MAIRVVSTTGNDTTGTGSVANPYLTIAKAASLVNPGDDVRVMPGTYVLDGGHGSPPYQQFWYSLQTTRGGTAAQRIRYISDTKWSAKLVGIGADMAFRQDGNYVDLIGFDVTTSVGNWGISLGGDFCTARYNYVHDMTGMVGEIGAGIVAGAGISFANFNSTNNWAIGNKVVNIYPSPASDFVHGIYLAHPGGGAANNIVVGASSGGINSYHYATGFIVDNNLCINSRNYGIGIAADHLVQTCTGCLIRNNIIRDNRSDGNPPECWAIYQGEGTVGAHNLYKNNLVYGGNTTIHFDSGGDAAVGTLNVDPLMVNYQLDGSGDYHLQASSPAINAGVVGSIAEDFDVHGRPQAATWDIGPYEYGVYTRAYASCMLHT